MARLDRIPGRSALAGLVLLCAGLPAGCAQLEWSSRGPGAPGPQAAGPTEAELAALASGAGRQAFPSLEPAPPFPASDRERITLIQPVVEQVAVRHQIDPDLINGVIWVESRFQPRAKSPAGARGLMQLMPATASAMARELGRPVARVFEPEFNVEAGSVYLLKLLDRYDGDEILALAAYNAGAGNVNKWMANDGELPPRSLQYVESVQRARMRFVAMRDERAVPGSTDDRTLLAAAPPRSEPRPEPRPEVPPPPASPRAEDRGASQPRPARTRERPRPEPEPEPELEPELVNPLAPSPDVYRPEPTPEPPLADTPYPPILEPRPARASEPEEPVDIRRPRALPSVLD